MPPGTLVNLQFLLPGEHWIRTRGEVIWINDEEGDEEEGMGIRFLGLQEQDREQILNCLKKLAIL